MRSSCTVLRLQSNLFLKLLPQWSQLLRALSHILIACKSFENLFRLLIALKKVSKVRLEIFARFKIYLFRASCISSHCDQFLVANQLAVSESNLDGLWIPFCPLSARFSLLIGFGLGSLSIFRKFLTWLCQNQVELLYQLLLWGGTYQILSLRLIWFFRIWSRQVGLRKWLIWSEVLKLWRIKIDLLIWTDKVRHIFLSPMWIVGSVLHALTFRVLSTVFDLLFHNGILTFLCFKILLLAFDKLSTLLCSCARFLWSRCRMIIISFLTR